ncbi:MAG: 4-(cytidine 5'-diphospho)-2-C-methyl-D-erythritol kinase [Pseudomonadota bacterium]
MASGDSVVSLAGGRGQAPARLLARAKVNLFLHLRGQRDDGYHLLESLVVFPEIGDVVEIEDGPGLGLSIDGPFAWDLPVDGTNLVLAAAERLAAATGQVRPRASLRLVKNLPIASGIGGGSADAAAALALCARAWGVEVPGDVALALGADVPVCTCAPRPTWMAGIGERVAPGPVLPPFWMVLANPLTAVSTPAIFRATSEKDCPAMAPAPAAGLADFDALTGWLGEGRNDLEPAARSLCPAIGEILEALSDAPLARMSGSGATCFALYATEAAALAAADTLRAADRGWWVGAARCG